MQPMVFSGHIAKQADNHAKYNAIVGKKQTRTKCTLGAASDPPKETCPTMYRYTSEQNKPAAHTSTPRTQKEAEPKAPTHSHNRPH